MLIFASRRRIAAAAASAVLGLALLTGCSNEDVSCGLNQCTWTIQRSTEASVSVLGVEAKFVSADASSVTLDVAGEQIQLSTAQPSAEVAGLRVGLESINADTIKIQISK